jgi:hypothetical protein
MVENNLEITFFEDSGHGARGRAPSPNCAFAAGPRDAHCGLGVTEAVSLALGVAAGLPDGAGCEAVLVSTPIPC